MNPETVRSSEGSERVRRDLAPYEVQARREFEQRMLRPKCPDRIMNALFDEIDSTTIPMWFASPCAFAMIALTSFVRQYRK